MVQRILLLALFYCIALPVPAANLVNINTQEYMLDNGLKIVVREDHRSPLVVSQVWYKVGGSYEHAGSTGISHALEHMMFRGTPIHPAGQFSRLIAEVGGQQNAFTGHDYTAYYQQLAVSNLPLCFELEADRMQNLSLAQDAFEKELKVVQEERRLRTEDNPDAKAHEHFYAASFINNPYQHPVIGWMTDISALSVGDLRAWYQSWYGPNNATLVVVGDVKPHEVFELAKKYFGPLKPITVPTFKRPEEPPYVGERRINVSLPAEVSRLFMGYNVPVIRTASESWEPYALLVLTLALDGGNSSRFSENLLRKQAVAANIQSWYNPFSLFSSQLGFSATPTEGHSLTELEAAFLAEIDRLQKTPLEESELKRIKAITLANELFKQDSIEEQANKIGSLETVGLSWRLFDSYKEQVQAVTAEQVQLVARKYLLPERRTIAYLTPQKMDANP